jgi:MtaA/CmuA family methyltransferase
MEIYGVHHMTGLERTLSFIRGESTDRPPFHPIIMQWAAKFSKVDYSDFCLKPEAKCKAMMECANAFDMDWVTVMSDPYCEAEGYGLEVKYPKNNLPHETGPLIKSFDDVHKLQLPIVDQVSRMINRVHEIEIFKKETHGAKFILGWVEGPMAEYADLRGLSDACLDLYDQEDEIEPVFDLLLEGAMRFATRQIEAGANCIGIGDAACSQIGPSLYRKYIFEREKKLVHHIQAQGALAKLHICGNTSDILPDMIATGVNIIDVDHLVKNLTPYSSLLGKSQVISGQCDPVSVILNGSPEQITEAVHLTFKTLDGKNIVSAGCEVPRDTSSENMFAFSKAASMLK